MRQVDDIWIIEPRTDDETIMDLAMTEATYIETLYDGLLRELERMRDGVNKPKA